MDSRDDGQTVGWIKKLKVSLFVFATLEVIILILVPALYIQKLKVSLNFLNSGWMENMCEKPFSRFSRDFQSYVGPDFDKVILTRDYSLV